MKMLELINKKNYINGSWIECQDQIPVNNPSTNQQIGSVPSLSDDLITKAIDNTVTAFKTWSQTSIQHRSIILKKWHSLILKNIDELANILTLEQGKILEDAKKEILYGANFVEWFAGSIHEIKGKIRSGKEINHKIITEWDPVGPVAAITPWNFPNAMITRKVTPALAAGCSVILKPSEFTPFSSLALVKLAGEAGIPDGVFNIITGDSTNIGEIFCSDFQIRKLSFTGSTRVGKLLYKNSSVTMKRLSMELGGNAPYIIFKDTDLDKVSSDLISIKIRSAGQSCTSPNRVFVEEAIYDNFVQIVLDKFSKLKVGDGFAPDSDIGPLINRAAVDKIAKLLEDAKSKGAKILCGGIAENNFFKPTVISDCQDNMEIFKTEIFGPVLAFYKFDNIEEVIERANNTEYGLQSYVYSKDISIAQAVAARLDFSMVSVNDSMPSANITGAFSGRKNSGFGIESSDEAIYEYLNSKYLNFKF